MSHSNEWLMWAEEYPAIKVIEEPKDYVGEKYYDYIEAVKYADWLESTQDIAFRIVNCSNIFFVINKDEPVTYA